MKKIYELLIVEIVLVILLAAARFIAVHPVHAQAGVAGPSFQYVALKSSCTVSVGVTVFCYSADAGMLQSINGAAFVQLGGVPSITINGKTGTTFTISATSTAPTVTASAPAVTVIAQ